MKSGGLPTFLASWILLFAVALGFQWLSGSWDSDFGGHADEGAHVVTGLMMRDYLGGGFMETPHPLRYAEDYYARFPKVAIGHYPPGFYVLESVLLLPFRNPAALLVMMAGLAATVARQTMSLGRDLGLKGSLGWIPAVLIILLPLVATYTSIVMSDLLLAALVLAATRSFGIFLKHERWRDGLAFGLWSAAAILTKGSGLMLALVPPLAIALSGRWHLLRSPRLWVAPVPVLLLALPWILATRHITEEGMQEMGMAGYLSSSVRYYADGIVYELGWILCILLVGAFVLTMRDRFRTEDREVVLRGSVWWSLIIGLLVFYVVVPSGLDTRYLLPLGPPALVLVLSSVQDFFRNRSLGLQFGVTLGVALVIGVETYRPVEKCYTGASRVISTILSQSGTTESLSVLVVSDARGEGAVTSAAAFSAPDRLIVNRGTKMLSSSDWLGRDYQSNFQSPEELQTLLDEHRVDYIVVETLPGQRDGLTMMSHWVDISRMVGEDSPPAFLRSIGNEESKRKRGQSSGFSIFEVLRSRVPES